MVRPRKRILKIINWSCHACGAIRPDPPWRGPRICPECGSYMQKDVQKIKLKVKEARSLIKE